MTRLRRKRKAPVPPRPHPGDTSLPADWFEQALLLHQSGKLAEAGALYNEILGVAPAHFDALHLLGVIACEHGDYHEGARLIGKALKSMALVLEQAGELARAREWVL